MTAEQFTARRGWLAGFGPGIVVVDPASRLVVAMIPRYRLLP